MAHTIGWSRAKDKDGQEWLVITCGNQVLRFPFSMAPGHEGYQFVRLIGVADESVHGPHKAINGN